MLNAEFVQEIAKLSRNQMHEVDGHHYAILSSGKILEISPLKLVDIRRAPSLAVSTLSSLVDFCLHNDDDVSAETDFVHVVSPHEVKVYSKTDQNGDRHMSIIARTLALDMKSSANFADYEELAAFVLKNFWLNERSETLLGISARVRDDRTVETEDDGVSQTIQMKVGSATVGSKTLTNPIKLNPANLFADVDDMPAVPYLFRVHKPEMGYRFSLREVSNAIWEANVMNIYAKYLQERLEGWRVFA